MKQKKNTIEKYLKRNKEIVVVELNINNYSKSNFYLAIVYNLKINMYKVLYIPLDIIDDGKIEDFVCYQFIDMMSVNYIVDNIKEYEDKFDADFCNKENELIDTYKVEININLGENKYQFLTTKFIPKEWSFMFEMIVTIFQYVPHIVNDLCEELLTLFKDEAENIKYQESFEFDLLRDDEEILIEKFGEEHFDFKKISQLEKINNKYFCLVDSKLVIIEYDFGVVNTYCSDEDYFKYVLTTLMAIRERNEKKFSKIMVLDKDNASLARFYLVYGCTTKGFKVVQGVEETVIPLAEYKNGLVKITEDYHNLEEKIEG